MKNNPFDFFDKIYCINLPESTDRWNRVAKEFEKVGVLDKVERISAPKPNKIHIPPGFVESGQYGCTMSHLKALGKALKNANGHIAIFEDDVQFTDDAEHRFSSCMKYLPSNWDIVYLGGQPVKSVNSIYKKTLFSVSTMRGSYGYVINSASIWKLYESVINDLTTNITGHDGIYDYILGKFSKLNNSYAIYPLIVMPVPNISIIKNVKTDNYNDIINTRWKTFANV